MNRKDQIKIIALIVAIVIVGVGDYFIFNWPVSSPKPVPDPTEDSDLITTSDQKQSVQSQSPENISQAHNIFGFNSIKILTKEEGNKNVFISPFSIALDLSMVYNGANGDTKSAMQKTLQFQNLDITTVNQESLGLMDLLRNPDSGVELLVANSIWVREGKDLKNDFLNTVADYFNAKISTLDFSNPKAVDTINTWVSKNTNNKIPNIISSPIDRGVVMYLINAVYFKGIWTDGFKFDKGRTNDKDFTTADGSIIKRPLMWQHNDFQYFESEDFQSVSLPYGKNKRLSMYVFLPKNLDNFVQTLDENKWNNWMEQYNKTDGIILLPKFKIEYEKGLIPLLTQLGMGSAFQGNADFTGIGDNLYISEVKHKTYIDVNEEGTEAAAVTNLGMVGATAPSPDKKTFYMEVNRPFFFVIRDNQTQEILFMGTIQNP
jgi:serpin B